MNPTPQHLPAVVDQFSDAGLFYILQHGVQMSGMPAWTTESRADEVWSMVAFTRRLDEMSPETYLSLVTPDADAGIAIPFGQTTDPSGMDYYLETYPVEQHAYSAPTGGFADYALAGIPVAQCTTCHGADGSGAPTMGEAPNLTLQTPAYIAASLRAYATAERESGFMQVLASQLSDAQIDALATYYGESLPDAPSPTGAPAPGAELLAAGERLAREGRPIDGISACLDCHGSGSEPGAGGEIIVPALAGQSATFLERQLRQFRADGRGQVSAWNPMRGVAHEIETDEIEAVSAWFASLEPGSARGRTMASAPSPEQVALATATIGRVCSECHTESLRGVDSGEYPNLTLQTPAYLQRSLYAFHTQRRENSRMNQAAQALDAEQIDALAAYIGNLPVSRTPPASELPGDPALGAQIVEAGLPDRGVPACLTCHGPDSVDDMPHLPRLHGQNANYLLARLRHFRDREPDDRLINPMPAYAKALSGDEIAAAASWFAEQDPLPKNDTIAPAR